MSLTKKQILSNKEKFITLNNEHKFFTDELLEFLGEEFFVSPATVSTDMYNCYPGGLLYHLLRVCKYSIEINELLPENLKVDKLKVMKTVFLSQIGKVYLFKPNDSEWHIKNQGKYYVYRDDDKSDEIPSFTVGERSIRYATQYGVKLDDEEFQAIINVDKKDYKQNKWTLGVLSHVIKVGFDMALIEDKYKS